MSETGLVKFDAAKYPALVPELRDGTMAAMRDNIGGAQLRALDLDRITVPAGGGLFWLVKSLDNPDGIPLKELTGVIVFQQRSRAFWAKGLGDGDAGTPPDCISNDCLVGIGTPGGSCITCPKAQFGSDAKGGKSQACSEKRVIFLLQAGKVLPTVMMIPPSSLKNLNTYMLRLAQESMPYYAIETKVGLEKAQSGDGVGYSKVTFTPGARITGDAAAQIVEFSKLIKATFQSAPIQIVDETPF